MKQIKANFEEVDETTATLMQTIDVKFTLRWVQSLREAALPHLILQGHASTLQSTLCRHGLHKIHGQLQQPPRCSSSEDYVPLNCTSAP